jgi:hypothetical protein
MRPDKRAAPPHLHGEGHSAAKGQRRSLMGVSRDLAKVAAPRDYAWATAGVFAARNHSSSSSKSRTSATSAVQTPPAYFVSPKSRYSLFEVVLMVMFRQCGPDAGGQQIPWRDHEARGASLWQLDW